MDLYDAAFLIDYLRDWAMKLNRIVIMAANPPTYELLAMFSKGVFRLFLRSCGFYLQLFNFMLCSICLSDSSFPSRLGMFNLFVVVAFSCLACLWEDDLFWKVVEDGRVLRIDWISLPAVQESMRLLRFVACLIFHRNGVQNSKVSMSYIWICML